MSIERLRLITSVFHNTPDSRRGSSRRRFFGVAAGALAGAFGGRLIASETPTSSSLTSLSSAEEDRSREAYQVRVAAAELERRQPRPRHSSNGDERLYDNKCASYSKGLPHDDLGNVSTPAYRTYLQAIESGDAKALEKIPLGGYAKLSNPQAAFAFDLLGPDAQQLAIKAPPCMHSEVLAAELIELYWQALLRDVPFAEYESNASVANACRDLTALSAFGGPRDGNAVTPATLFRGGSRGGRVGPYLSQFLIRDIPYGATKLVQKYRVAVPGRDYLTQFEEWRAIQNGGLAPSTAFSGAVAHMTTPRGLTEYVHRDFTYQAFLSAALMLLKMSAPLDGGISYQYSIDQAGFVTFGAPEVLHYVAAVANCSLKPAWYQKWIVHRSARPEEIGARVHCHLEKKARYPLHRSVLESEAVGETRRRSGTALLSQAYPEGCPMHPSFPAGHAVIAGACATTLKAWFAESWVLPIASSVNADGTALAPYTGPDLTVGGELDKLAENIAIGRNFAGVHWRSDAIEGLHLGEAFAIQFLREMKLTSKELFSGFRLTKFDGSQITI